MKKKFLSLVLAGVTIATPILSTSTAFANEEGCPSRLKSQMNLRSVSYMNYVVTVNGDRISLINGYTHDRLSYFTLTKPENVVGYGRVTRGNQVIAAQVMLSEIRAQYTHMGFGFLSADGIFGASTRDAVIKFQKKAGITADGIIGPNTWRKMVWWRG